MWQKTVEDLFLEIKRGESHFTITAEGLLRHVSVVRAHITDGHEHSLIEVSQKLPSGTVRERNFPLSGKISAGEAPDTCLAREIREELGFEISSFQDVHLREVRVDKYEAPSYAGLVTVFTYYEYDLRMKPDFIAEKYEREEKDGTQSVFAWRPNTQN
jgi:8-oxo-dGTP pyrophosphatase MutT (NUDIX family)